MKNVKNVTPNKVNQSNLMKLAWVKYNECNGRLTFAHCLKNQWRVEKTRPTFEQVYKLYYNDILTFITYKLLGKYEDAQELTQNIFLKINKHLCNYDETKSKLRTWVYHISNNVVIDYFRVKRLNVIQISELQEKKANYDVVSDYSYESDSLVIAIEINNDINKAFDELKGMYKEVAIQWFKNQLSQAEIAIMFNISENNAKQHIFRAKQALALSLKKYQGI